MTVLKNMSFWTLTSESNFRRNFLMWNSLMKCQQDMMLFGCRGICSCHHCYQSHRNKNWPIFSSQILNCMSKAHFDLRTLNTNDLVPLYHVFSCRTWHANQLARLVLSVSDSNSQKPPICSSKGVIFPLVLFEPQSPPPTPHTRQQQKQMAL